MFMDDLPSFEKQSCFGTVFDWYIQLINQSTIDLANLAAWSNDWQMLFNVEKCKVMHMCYNNTCSEYFLNGTKLESVSEEKDLRVFISDDLKWDKQCSQAVAKANRVLGLLKRNFTDRSKEGDNFVISV